MKAYCYSKCSTCKKALSWLDAKGIKYDLVDIKIDHPSKEDLTQWYAMGRLPLKKFFNTSGNVYKALGLKDKLPTMNEDEQLEILATDGMLIKRPLIIGEDFVFAGFKESEWEERVSTWA